MKLFTIVAEKVSKKKLIQCVEFSVLMHQKINIIKTLLKALCNSSLKNLK